MIVSRLRLRIINNNSSEAVHANSPRDEPTSLGRSGKQVA
ncbi:hypothetical protein RB10657 [Rhodopirellula baltica SH 1]|uniref:Uncharacterized protein n=1 Tax=Rhodopirellula baltica (strain DSM 10527 / NCIMB 13988 / SH1) TaxID=243090 RepID=Q7UKG3_RHOBA|nr:hypothetical protein RB10657 [Rhodopirellula baltica SH 1]